MKLRPASPSQVAFTVLEMGLKIGAVGALGYWHTPWWRFEGVICVLMFASKIATVAGAENGVHDVVMLFRSLQFVRVITMNAKVGTERERNAPSLLASSVSPLPLSGDAAPRAPLLARHRDVNAPPKFRPLVNTIGTILPVIAAYGVYVLCVMYSFAVVGLSLFFGLLRRDNATLADTAWAAVCCSPPEMFGDVGFLPRLVAATATAATRPPTRTSARFAP